MKKNLVYAMMSAIALTSAVSFTGCASDDSASVDTNPTYDGNSVRTDFAFNITKASQGTRMSAVNVQENDNFLGMTNMYLFPFKGEPGSENKKTIQEQPNYPLGNLDGITATASSKVYSLTIPVGTDNFLFYARANNTSTNFEKGVLNSTLFHNGTTNANVTAAAGVKDIDNISFGLQSIATDLGEDADNIADYLTEIANVSGWAGTVTEAATNGNYQALARLYTNFTANYNARSGSAEAVTRMLLDLYRSALKINKESSVTSIQNIAQAICDAILKLSSDDTTVKLVVNATNADPNNWTATLNAVNSEFPANLGLPMGAAQLKWDNSEFIYIDKPHYAASTTYVASTKLEKYCYPAELVYFDNSPLRATNSYKKDSDFPKTPGDWDKAPGSTPIGEEVLFSSDWSDTQVKASTRAVAMTNNVNYGVALLETQVKLASMSLEDNMSGIAGGDDDQTITFNETNKLFVTGLLIGDQPESVDWNMVNPDDDFDNVIYDNAITFKGTALSMSYSAPNYTIVLDNYCNETQKPVLIALQIKNGNTDFYGKDGLIPAGCTFYLVGQLVLSQSTNDWSSATPGESAKVDRPDTYRITNEDTKRVFVQDYKTTAKINITADALKNAYSTIPDLRSTEVVFGLSVQLDWEHGLNFEINM